MPNQHGAWAMLATPLGVGILAGSAQWIHIPLTLFWFLGYFAFFATTLWLKSGRRERLRRPAATYSVAAAAAGLTVWAFQPGIVRWAALFVVPLGVGMLAASRHRERSVLAGLATTVGSCLMTPVAYDAGIVAAGMPAPQWARVWVLTAVLAAYFGGTVLYVKSLIRERGSTRHLALSVGWHALATVATWFASPILAAVFAVLTWRAWWAARHRFTPRQIGIGEVFATVTVSVVALLVT